MIEELMLIRGKLMEGVENKDLLYIKMQINNIDTLIYDASNISKEKKKRKICGNCNHFILIGCEPVGTCTRTDRTGDHLSYSRGCKYFISSCQRTNK